MKTSPLSAQLNSSNIHFLENLSLHHSIPQPLTALNRTKRTITRIRANKDLKTASENVYQENILRLLDELNSPILMLPRVEQGRVVHSIGFFTDLRFTGHSTLSMVAKMARSYHASIVIFNVSESHLPPMDAGYAESFFKRQGLETIDGVPAKLVNLTMGTASELEKIFTEHQIGMLTALQERKNLLYNLIA
ncbi:MAG TPA: hypothetical protein VGE15_01630 [Sphingobacteriaceae bacterium]